MQFMVTLNNDSSEKKGSDFIEEMLSKGVGILGSLAEATIAVSKQASIDSTRHLINFHRSAIMKGLNLVAKAHDVAEDSLLSSVKEGKWLPGEGKEIIDAWSESMKNGLEDFSKVTDKSFELLIQFLDRVEKEKAAAEAKDAEADEAVVVDVDPIPVEDAPADSFESAGDGV